MSEIQRRRINLSSPNLISICVDEKKSGEISGRMYHYYQKEPLLFQNIEFYLAGGLLLGGKGSDSEVLQYPGVFETVGWSSFIRKHMKIAENAEIDNRRLQFLQSSVAFRLLFRYSGSMEVRTVWNLGKSYWK